MKRKSIATYIVIAVLALFGIGGIVGGTVAVNMVDDNLKAQKITFGEDTKWSGQQVTNGWDAYHFQQVIDKHVKAALKPVGMTTYEEISAAARATVTDKNPAGDPKLMGLRRTALDGQLLRGTRFSSFAWWMVGWVGIGAGIAFSLLAVLAFFIAKPKDEKLFFPVSETTRETVSV
jgi:hypothetical protein